MDRPLALLGASSLLQSTLPGETGRWRALLRAPQLDAVVRRPLEDGVALDHHHRPQGRPDRGWVQGATLTLTSTAPAAIAQARGRPGVRGWRHGDLHVLSPEAAGLVHHVRRFTPDGLAEPWVAHGFAAPRAEAVALVAHGDALDALVLDAGVQHLRHVGSAWRTVATLTDAATGAPALATVRGTLVAAVPTDAGVQGWRLTEGGWRSLGTLADGPGEPALAASGSDVLLAVASDAGVRVFRGTPDRHRPWPQDGTFATVPIGGLALAASALGDGLDLTRLGLGVVGRTNRWTQALVQEGGSVHLWHRQGVGRWARAACVRFVDPDPVVVDSRPSQKVAQVSGEHDSQPWADGPRATLSASESTSGVRGTDLGVRVEHAGRSYLLCGDTHFRRRRWATRDAIAAVDGDPTQVPRVTFHGAPLRFSPGVTMTEYDVPYAFSLGGDWFVFATSNHFAHHQVMGRSVLTLVLDDPATIAGTSRRPLRFRTLATVSDWRFVTVSCQWVAPPPGIDAAGEVVALWGSGSYRADDLRLAILDPRAIADALRGRRPVPTEALGLRFYAGSDAAGLPTWSDAEADAATVVPGAFGEVSVRWVPDLERYVLLAMTGPQDAAGGAVVLRTASDPWGPWSARRVLLDWISDGLSFGDPQRRFIRAHVADDPVGDSVFRAQASATGGAYAPYLFDSRRDGDDVVLRYTLSTWNPYQIVLMEHRLGRATVEPCASSPGT